MHISVLLGSEKRSGRLSTWIAQILREKVQHVGPRHRAKISRSHHSWWMTIKSWWGWRPSLPQQDHMSAEVVHCKHEQKQTSDIIRLIKHIKLDIFRTSSTVCLLQVSLSGLLSWLISCGRNPRSMACHYPGNCESQSGYWAVSTGRFISLPMVFRACKFQTLCEAAWQTHAIPTLLRFSEIEKVPSSLPQVSSSFHVCQFLVMA